MNEGTVLAVHPYPRYVDEEAFEEVIEELDEEFPVYGVEASNSSSELVGDLYEDTFEDIDGGKNGSFDPGNLEGLDEPFYITGGLLNECVPGAIETVIRSGKKAFLVEDGSYERFEDEFMTYRDMLESEEDYSDVFRNLYMLGVETVEVDDIV